LEVGIVRTSLGAVLPSEHVEIVNDGADPVPVTGLELTSCSGQHHEHVYLFPEGSTASRAGASARTPAT
jgi:hypothetical protein